MQVGVNILLKPIAAAYADRRSRICVLVWSLGCGLCGQAVTVLAAYVANRRGTDLDRDEGDPDGTQLLAPFWLLVLANALLGGMVTNSVVNSLFADLTPKDKHGHALVLLVACACCAFVLGFGISVFVLILELQNYTIPCLAFACAMPIAGLPLLGLRDVSHPKDERSSIRLAGRRCRDVAGFCCDVFNDAGLLARSHLSILLRHSVLQRLCVGCFVLTFGTVGAVQIMVSFTMANYDWDQSSVLLIALIAVPCASACLDCIMFHPIDPPPGMWLMQVSPIHEK